MRHHPVTKKDLRALIKHQHQYLSGKLQEQALANGKLADELGEMRAKLDATERSRGVLKDENTKLRVKVGIHVEQISNLEDDREALLQSIRLLCRPFTSLVAQRACNHDTYETVTKVADAGPATLKRYTFGPDGPEEHRG